MYKCAKRSYEQIPKHAQKQTNEKQTCEAYNYTVSPLEKRRGVFVKDCAVRRAFCCMLDLLFVFQLVALLMMAMSTFIAHESINTNAQCTEQRESHNHSNKGKNTCCKVVHRTGGFSDVSGTP